MKKIVLLAAATMLIGCLEPETKATAKKVPPKVTVQGRLAYRSTCQGGEMKKVAGLTLPEDLQPRLYLVDGGGHVASPVVTTGADGVLSIGGLNAGQYQLYIEHQALGAFWQDGSKLSLPVLVSAADAAVGGLVLMGVICEDNNGPVNGFVRASWGEAGDTTTASTGATLHMWSGVTSATLNVTSADPDGDPISWTYRVSKGQVVSANGIDTWRLEGVQPGAETLNVFVSDGRGGILAIDMAVRFHQSRIEKAMGAVRQDLSTPAGAQNLSYNGGNPSLGTQWNQTASGIQAVINQGNGQASLAANSAYTLDARMPVNPATTADITGLNGEMSFGIALRAVDNMQTLRVTVARANAGSRMTLRYTEPNGSIDRSWTVAINEMVAGDQPRLALAYDPATKSARATLSKANDLTAFEVSLTGVTLAGKGVTPVIFTERWSDCAGALVITFAALEIENTPVYRFPSEATTYNGINYNQTLGGTANGWYFYMPPVIVAASGELAMPLPYLPSLTRALVTTEQGLRIAGLTTASRAQFQAATGTTLDLYDPDAVTPLLANEVYLR